MKRFLLFGFDTYYPGGGWVDFIGSFATAQQAMDASTGENAHVVDSETGEMIHFRDEHEPWEAGKR